MTQLERADLIGATAWLPALVGVVSKLEYGASVADVGCGHGSSTLVFAEAYPASTFVGFDAHAASIERATELAKRAGVDDRVRFETAPAEAFTGGPYDLICLLAGLPDVGDPAAALEQCRRQLTGDGTVVLVEHEDNVKGRKLIEVAHRAGFTGARVATSTAVNLILELTS